MTVTPFTTWRLHKPDGTLDQQAYDEFLEYSKGAVPAAHRRRAGRPGAADPLPRSRDAAKYATGNIFRVNGGQTMVW